MKLVMNPAIFVNSPELGMGFHFAKEADSETFALVIHSLVAVERHELYDGYSRRKLSDVLRELDRIFSINHFLYRAVWPEQYFAPFNGLERANFQIENRVWKFVEYFDAPGYFKEGNVERRLHESPPFDRSARLTDVFYRYSIIRTDPKVGPNGELAVGTYAAPSSEVAFVLNGLAAVGRYALPAMLPRCYKFKISPPDGVPIKVGACQPNFGQAGGGVEVEFTSALPAGSVTIEANLPEF